VVGALVAVASVVALAATTWFGGDAEIAVPSPLFDDVEQLSPTALPEGWGRCGGGPADQAGATERWWQQTFGPVEDGHCTPLVTVIQIPPGDDVDLPDDATNGGIGEEPGRTGAKHWTDRDAGSRGLYTTASGGLQRLVVVGCCGEEATGDAFLQVAEGARDATRERAPDWCDEPHSDLDQESFLINYFARHERAFDDEGCPVRGDIVSWRTEPPTAHCYPGVRFLTVGAPVGAPFAEGDARTYTRDPEGSLGSRAGAEPGLDLDAQLPRTAVDTGFHQGAQSLWVDDADAELVYLVSDEGVEAWPRDRERYGCA
jgi:hypothetical protein